MDQTKRVSCVGTSMIVFNYNILSNVDLRGHLRGVCLGCALLRKIFRFLLFYTIYINYNFNSIVMWCSITCISAISKEHAWHSLILHS